MRGSFSESARNERFQTQFARTGELLALFDEILIQLAAIPGRKSLILISDGFPRSAFLTNASNARPISPAELRPPFISSTLMASTACCRKGRGKR